MKPVWHRDMFKNHLAALVTVTLALGPQYTVIRVYKMLFDGKVHRL